MTPSLLHPKINGRANKAKLIMVIIISLVLPQGRVPGVHYLANHCRVIYDKIKVIPPVDYHQCCLKGGIQDA